MVDTSGYGLLKHLRKLSDGEFWSFKELLRKEPEKFKLKPISWMKIENASKEELVMLLNTHYPKQAWDMALSLFLQVNREDLSIMAQKKRRYKQTKYKKFMKTTFQSIWTLESNICIPDRSYHLIVEHQYRKLQNIFDSESEPVTAVVTGPTGEGKTVFLRKAMLDWASGILWQNRFQYVFFFSVLSLNNTTELSLAELISSKLPESSETLNDILSDPKKILFILDGFDYLKFDLELRTNLCNDWRKILPTQIILSSLLQKIMLPESSLLLELGHISLPKIFPLLQYPRDITIQGFSERCLKTYFISFFNTEKGIEVFENLKSNQMLKLCSNPYLCWMFCSCLKWQFDREEEAYFQAKTDSVFFTSFMVSAFKSAYASNPPKQNRAQLKSLCTLAVEGMWKQLFVFDSEDLRRNGISESDKAVWLRMKFLQNHDNHIVFYHPTLQLYFASMFYFLKQDKDTHVPVIGSIPQLLRKIYARDHTQWLQIGIFLFGLATEQVASLLKPYFGFIQHRDVRQEVMRYLKSLSQRECCEKLERPQNLFACLRDNKEEKFVREVVDLFEEITVDITNSHVLSIIANHLQKSSKLKKLHLHIQKRVFLEIHDPEYSDSETFTQDKKNAAEYWKKLCHIFVNLHVLDLDSCNFNKQVIEELCNVLSPSPKIPLMAFKLESLLCSFMTNFGDGSLFHTLLQLPHLKYLNLYGTNLSNSRIENLCSALRRSTCKVEELLLGKCDISSEACGIIATSLMNSKVKHLSLVENPLKNKGVMSLCEMLKDPSCVLETLMLSYCCLTFIACGHLYEALVSNKHLSLLDLGSNFLEDTGVNLLCEALKDPNCILKELWLSGCFLTSECCEEISAVLTCNNNLKTLKLGNNDIEDTGVKHLCEALSHPNCKLECLGLDLCKFTSDCCEDLASALTTCKTLNSLNLDWKTLEHSGVVALCEALNHKKCNLKMLGLDKSAFSVESQTLLQAVEKKNNNLSILHYPWVEEERKKRGVRLVWNSKN
ncbi:NACHT, LRR and PYD domains-containing protein 9 [Rattus norvegicus]|uniref:NLR family, pyrin domain containing 9 n=1 Tax=Rattus norvegicus TaxID=10116 RepID=A0ABK0LTA6_RAT|nr:NACHT, LRR and PYD domains-containing protein 9 [Rattus norvegicus]|eukprot:NP_001162620.1 NACHT, LRR and PYD domains-containing protein 9 [Rattus norvegicus]